MLDLTAAHSVGSGHLTKIGITSDGKSVAQGALLFDLRLSFDVEQDFEIDAIDPMLRGARAYFDSVKGTEETGAFSRSPSDTQGQFELTYVADGVVVVDATGEVAKVELVKARKGFVYNVSVRFRGLDAVTAAHFARHLNRVLMVRWAQPTTTQQPLPFAAPETNAVQIVSAEDGAGGYLFGAQVGVDGTTLMLDDFGRPFEIPKERVVGKVIMTPPESGPGAPPMYEFLLPYSASVNDSGGKPSWKWLILALAEAQNVDVNSLESTVYRLTANELKRAAELAVADVVQ